MTPITHPVNVVNMGLKPILTFIKVLGARQQLSSEKIAQLMLRFQQEFTDSCKSLQSLARKGIIRYSHYQTSVYTLFFAIVEERLQLLKCQRTASDPIYEKWHAFKMAFAKDRQTELFMNKELVHQLDTLLNEVSELLEQTNISSSEFNSSIQAFLRIVSYQHVGDVAIACFFEKKDLVQQANFSSPLPAGALYQDIHQKIKYLKQEFEWINSFFATTIKEALNAIPHHPDGKIMANITMQASLYWQTRTILIQKLSILSISLKSNTPIDSSQIKNLIADIQKGGDYWQRILEPKPIALHFYRLYTSLKNVTDFFIEEPLLKLSHLLLSFSKLQETLQSFSQEKRQSYLAEEFPIYPKLSSSRLSAEQLGYEVPRQLSQKRHVQRKKKVKKAQPSRQGRQVSILKTETEEGQPLAEQPSLPLKKKVDILSHISDQLSAFASTQGDPATLFQAAWHLNKVAIIKKILQKPLREQDQLNLLTALSFHIAHTLEQLINHQLTLNGQSKERKVHNLNILYRLTQLPNPRLINKFYLATYWARYPFSEIEQWKQFTSFHRQEIPSLLQDIASMASEERKMSPQEFSAYCRTIIKEFEETLYPLLPFKEQTEVEQNHIEKSVPDIIDTSIDFQTIIELLTQLTKSKIGKDKANLKIRESLSSTAMLQSSWLQIQKTDQLDEFSFWSTRILFLLQESADHLLHALEIKCGKSMTTQHNIKELAKKLELNLNPFGKQMLSLSKKLKYPFATASKGLACKLIDTVTQYQLQSISLGQQTSDRSPTSKDLSEELFATKLATLSQEWHRQMIIILNHFNKET